MIRLTAVIEIEGKAPRALTHQSNSRTMTLGRDATADFQIPLTTVSRHHARISERAEIYVIEDLKSTHGTLLNGKRLEEGETRVIGDGDIIELTHAKITCNIEEDAVAIVDAGEGTKAIAKKAIVGILEHLGEAQGEDAYFLVMNGADEGARHSLGGGKTEWTMGRSKDCEFILNDANVSRRHAFVRKGRNEYLVSDAGSKNGVIVNEKKVDKVWRLKDRDELQVGPVKLVFIDPNAELMKQLADVPGFGSEEVNVDELNEDPSVIGSPEEPGEAVDEDAEQGAEQDFDHSLGEDLGPNSEEAMQTSDGEYGEEDFDDIDPALLESSRSKFPIEIFAIGIVLLLAAGAAGLLFLIL